MTTVAAPSALRARFDLAREIVAGRGRRLLDIADVKHGHRGQQSKHVKGALFLRLALDEPRRLALAQQRERPIDQVERLLGVLVAAFGFLAQAVDAPLQAVEIGQHQLGLDRLDIGDRIDPALHMGNVGILEAAHHMRDGIDLADIREELIAEPLAFGGAAHEARDIDEGQPGRNDLGRFGKLGERFEPRVGHRHFADIRLDGAEWIIGRLRRRRFGQRIEERRLADVRQADDAAFESHGGLFHLQTKFSGRLEPIHLHVRRARLTSPDQTLLIPGPARTRAGDPAC